MIDLAGDVALEDPDDLGVGAALFQAAFHVGLGAGIGTQSRDHHAPERRVGLVVTATIEPDTGHLARRGRDRGDAAEMRPGGLSGSVRDCPRRSRAK